MNNFNIFIILFTSALQIKLLACVDKKMLGIVFIIEILYCTNSILHSITFSRGSCHSIFDR